MKVYASWCKTCKVFDIRYRKVASQFGDKYNEKTGTLEQMGKARFAEMQYDNPNNEEMCKLLNATKLPYILMYKGSRGKVKEFQCGPANVQMLIDSVNELADLGIEDGDIASRNGNEGGATKKLPISLSESDLSASPQDGINPAVMLPTDGDNTIEGLQQQLIDLENEKIEMFEMMKAQIEYDKEYIKKLETGVETQRSMLEAKDDEISNLSNKLNEQQKMLTSKEVEVQSLTSDLKSEKNNVQQTKVQLSSYESQVTKLTTRISQIEETVTTLELESAFNEKSAKEKEKQLMKKMEEWEEQKKMYESERNSLRKLFALGIKRVGRGTRCLFSKIRRKNKIS